MSVLESRLSESLQEALREILRIERSLVEAGDRRMLARFGDQAHGAEIAARLGYTLLATDEARLVDQLTYLPNSQALIRELLQTASAPRLWEVERIAAQESAQSHGGGLKTQRPATIVATTSASRSSQGSRSSTTRSAA